jgi:hypothetical protein
MAHRSMNPLRFCVARYRIATAHKRYYTLIRIATIPIATICMTMIEAGVDTTGHRKGIPDDHNRAEQHLRNESLFSKPNYVNAFGAPYLFIC